MQQNPLRHWLLCFSISATKTPSHNPVKGVERPKTESGEGKAPAIGDHQAGKLLDAPAAGTIKSKRDRAILSTSSAKGPRSRTAPGGVNFDGGHKRMGRHVTREDQNGCLAGARDDTL